MGAGLLGASGRAWRIDTTRPAGPSTLISEAFYGYEVGNEAHRVWVLRAIDGGDLTYEEAREHRRASYRVGQIAEIAACPYIAAPIDLVDGDDVLTIAELADGVLEAEPVSDPGELEHALRSALAVLHGLDLVHGDVREANVLRFGGQWKLGDLGSVTRRGDPIETIQRDPAYRRPGAAIGAPADPANDLYALAVVLRNAVTRRPTTPATSQSAAQREA